MTDGYISGKRTTSYLIIVRNHILISGLDAASLGFGVASTTLQGFGVASRTLQGGGNIDPPPRVEVIGRGFYIDNDDIHTRENNVIEEGVYRPPSC